MRATDSQSRALCCISVQMKSYPALAIAQYVSGSVALNSVPPVTLPPCIILSFTGFQIFDPAGGLKAGPYFQAAASNGPEFTAPGGAVLIAPLSLPAGAASGKLSFPASALLAYGSALAFGCCPAGGCCPIDLNVINAAAADKTTRKITRFMC